MAADTAAPTDTWGKLDRRVRQRERHDVRNYLLSVNADSSFVARVRDAYPRYACLANLRNGARRCCAAVQSYMCRMRSRCVLRANHFYH